MKKFLGVLAVMLAFAGNVILLLCTVIVGVDMYARSREDKQRSKNDAKKESF